MSRSITGRALQLDQAAILSPPAKGAKDRARKDTTGKSQICRSCHKVHVLKYPCQASGNIPLQPGIGRHSCQRYH
ncbi:hypothetical protein RLV_5807 [Rhizobium leguminosarum bv. viciae]|nr:hypothetical protein RLV_5807 [Rhizobium leguminosarum bv. viciae]